MATEDTEKCHKRKIAALKAELQDEKDVFEALLRSAIVSQCKMESLRTELKHYEDILQVVSDMPYHDERDGSYPLLDMSHASSHWRAVAIGTPSLWAMGDIPLSHHLDNLTKLYIERSQQSLLNVWIEKTTTGVQLANSLQLSQFVQRCRSLGIYVSSSLFGLFGQTTVIHAPFLEKLLLFGDHHDGSSPHHFPLLRGGPALTLIPLGPEVLSSMCHVSFNPKALTTLSFSDVPGNTYLESLCDTLQKLPFLTDLTLEVPLCLLVRGEPIAIELGCLRFLRLVIRTSLRIRRRSRQARAGVCSMIRAPLLNHFEIDFSNYLESSNTLLNFIPLTYPELRTLKLCDPYNIDVLHEAASAFRDVTSLQIIGCIRDISHIFESPDGEVYWKHLQEFVLEISHIDFRKLASAMQKRKKMGYPVGKIELSCLIKDKEKRPDDWLHASLHDIGNRFTSLEVLELYMSSDATYDPLAPVADQHLVDL